MEGTGVDYMPVWIEYNDLDECVLYMYEYGS